jgi:L-ascorbate metabolism protein UlaG (beta-lactamase superfamily)
MNSSQAVEVISLIEPSVVVPMHYATPDTKIKGLEGVDRFLKEMGLAAVEPQDSLKLNSTASLEETQVVVLNYNH